MIPAGFSARETDSFDAASGYPTLHAAQPAGQMLAMRIEQGHWHDLGPMARHHLDKFTGIQVIPSVIGRNLDEAEARQATGDVAWQWQEVEAREARTVFLRVMVEAVVPSSGGCGESVHHSVRGLIVATALLIGSSPKLIGLAVVLPVLGQATLHLHRLIVAL